MYPTSQVTRALNFILKYGIGASYFVAISTASLLGGGTVKHTEGTMASLPAGLMTFHLAR